MAPRKDSKGPVRSRICPICGEIVGAKGFSGHLRFAHGITGEKAAEIGKTAPETLEVLDWADELVGLLERQDAYKAAAKREPDDAAAFELAVGRLEGRIKELRERRPV